MDEGLDGGFFCVHDFLIRFSRDTFPLNNTETLQFFFNFYRILFNLNYLKFDRKLNKL